MYIKVYQSKGVRGYNFYKSYTECVYYIDCELYIGFYIRSINMQTYSFGAIWWKKF